jgi:quercetin 2,3-dioxygenase
MFKHIPFNSLYKADYGWLTSRFHFSFAEYRKSSHFINRDA